MAFHELEPIPDPTWNAAQICAVTANANRAKGRPAKVEDFIPRVVRKGGKPRPKQSPAEMIAALKAATERRK
jgi:hypothetical protein